MATRGSNEEVLPAMASHRVLMQAFAVVCLLFSAFSSSAQAPAGPYIYELLGQPAFAASFDALFAGEANIDDWIKSYSRTHDGVASPSKTLRSGDRIYIRADLCRPHDCGNNQLHVLFAQDGSRAVAVQVTAGESRWFGNPGPDERALLQSD